MILLFVSFSNYVHFMWKEENINSPKSNNYKYDVINWFVEGFHFWYLPLWYHNYEYNASYARKLFVDKICVDILDCCKFIRII